MKNLFPMLLRSTPFMILLLAMTAYAQEQKQEQGVNRGQEILLPFKQELLKALQGGMEDGPLAALNACNLHAPGIANANSHDNVIVGRSSHRLRNPDNAAPAWVAPVMKAYLDNPDNRLPQTIALGDGQTGYVEPIMLQPLCTACHGSEIAPEVLDRIHALYPADQAIGFAPGDLRGVFWTQFPAN